MTRVLVTGADGFVGRRVAVAVEAAGYELVPIARDENCARQFQKLMPSAPASIVVGDIGPDTDWSHALEGVDAIIHLAARVHVMNETAADPLDVFREVNTRGTERLAHQAAKHGVSRLVFVSTIKVNGESTTGRDPYSERDTACPGDPYAVSKWEAEQVLHNIQKETGMETVIVRPPLVHGPGVGGNLKRLMGLVRRGIPLPLRTVKNRRSLIGVDNLAELLVGLSHHPAAANRLFTACDSEDLSTVDLIHELASGMGRTARLYPVPLGFVATLASAVGKGAVIDRLAGSLQVDASGLCDTINWRPATPIREGLRHMAQSYDDEMTATETRAP
jgi:nucleoside-diphosphate-sugar epimerase